MKKIIIFILLVIPYLTFAQNEFNLTGLKSVKIQLIDNYGALSKQAAQHLQQEIKMRCLAAGLKVTENKAAGALQMKIELVRSNSFADPRVYLSLAVLERVKSYRTLANINAYTYFNGSLLTIAEISLNDKIFVFYIDYLFKDFINAWLAVNES